MPQKKITICASMSFWDDINIWREKLEKDGYDVIQYPKQFEGEFLPNYKREFTEHYQKMNESDIVLVLNMKKMISTDTLELRCLPKSHLQLVSIEPALLAKKFPSIASILFPPHCPMRKSCNTGLT